MIDSLSIGGAERMAVNMANAFDDNGIENILIVSRKNGPLSEFLNHNSLLKILNKQFSGDIKAFIRCFRLIKRYEPEVLHCHSSSIFWGVAIKIFLPKIKLIFHDHYGESESLKEKDRKLIRLLSTNIDGVIAVNQKLEEWSKKCLKVDARNVKFVKNFPYLFIQDKSVDNKKISIVHLANLRPQKDHFMLLRALKRLLDECKLNFPVEVLMVGSFAKQDKYYIDVKNKIEDLNLGGICQINGPSNNVSTLLNTAVVGVLSSRSEGLPVSLLEYGLAELPVICTNVGQCAEVLNYGECGWLVTPGDDKAMASALHEAIENNSKASKKAKLLKRRIEKHYGANAFIRSYTKFINEL